MNKIKKRGQLNLSFGWLFAIIIGASILSLTIFGISKLVKNSNQEQQIIGAKELGIILNPLETSFESASSTPLKTSIETRIKNSCELFGNFGEQGISLSEFSFNKWEPYGTEIKFENKYIFSKEIVEGENFYIFSKPFEFPFKVSNLFYLTSTNEKYCFNEAPKEIEEEIIKLGQINLQANCSTTNKEKITKICFSPNFGKDCDVKIDFSRKYVEKNSEKVYFEGNSLMYAAIFSDKEIYECQLQRLLKRTGHLSEIYLDKSSLIEKNNCDNDLSPDLNMLISQIESIEDSSELSNINILIEDIQEKNENSYCRLW